MRNIKYKYSVTSLRHRFEDQIAFMHDEKFYTRGCLNTRTYVHTKKQKHHFCINNGEAKNSTLSIQNLKHIKNKTEVPT